jgi:chorismate-pyruvate lyase
VTSPTSRTAAVPNDAHAAGPHRWPEPLPDLRELAELFYPRLEDLGAFAPVFVQDLPPPYRRLLAHTGHMTETVEAFHDSPVDVSVLRSRRDPGRYSREILLRRRSDGRVVQHGIVRLATDVLSPAVRAEIESERRPLGRVLISHGVLRQVHLAGVWRVVPGPQLAAALGMNPGEETYGRTALIECDRAPAVELIEIVTRA